MELGSLEDGIDDIVGFHLNIVQHIEDTIDGISMKGNILCKLIDEQGNEYESLLDEDRYNKSLQKSLEFFKENLHRPYDAGMKAINFEQIKLMDDFINQNKNNCVIRSCLVILCLH